MATPPRITPFLLADIEQAHAIGKIGDSDVEMLICEVRALRHENQGLLAENAKLRGEAVESINHMAEER